LYHLIYKADSKDIYSGKKWWWLPISFIWNVFTIIGFALVIITSIYTHGHNIILNCCDLAAKITTTTHDLAVFHYSRIYKVLLISNISIFERVHFATNPLCPSFGLQYFRINNDGMLCAFWSKENTSLSVCQNKKVD